MTKAPVTTRFAPSPTGYLHLGHAFSALFAARQAGPAGGRFLLRIEDIDRGRCRPEYAAAIFEDLAWLGLAWEEPVLWQSARFDAYGLALSRLGEQGLLYPCFCTRRDIREQIARSASAPQGPDGPLYPGLCRGGDPALAADRIAAGQPHALRLDMARAIRQAGPLVWYDRDHGATPARPEIHGDVVLARKDVPTSYHLAVTLDDHFQGVTLVTRGEDLRPASHLHRLLQALLGLDVPEWRHHRLLEAADGRRLATRDGAASIRARREAGRSPESVRDEAGIAALQG